MHFAANHLTEEDTAQLIYAALSTTWPETSFATSFSGTSMHIHWVDGPWEDDVYAIASHYIAPNADSDWANTIILAAPTGSIYCAHPGLDELELDRMVSESTVEAVVYALVARGVPHEQASAPHLLDCASDPHAPTLDALAELNEHSAPLPPGIVCDEPDGVDEVDAHVTELCNLLDTWCNARREFPVDGLQQLAHALPDPECQAVLISALSDEAPLPGDVTELVEEVVNQSFLERDYRTAEYGRFVLTSVFPDLESAQPGLFETVSPRVELLKELGQLLRETTAGNRF